MRINGIYRTLVTVFAVLLFLTGKIWAENACYPIVIEQGVVYNDAVQKFWNVLPYSTTSNPVAITTGMIGSHAIKVEYYNLEGEYVIYRDDSKLWHTAGKRALVFRVKGIQNKGLGQVWVLLRSASLQTLARVPITDHMVTPPDGWNYDPNTWYTVTIPISALNAENVYVKELAFEGGQLADYANGGVGTIYLDEIWWVEGLEFPLKGETAYTAKISSVLDHVSSQSEFNCRDEWVVAYNGEVGHFNNDDSEWSTSATGATCVGQILQGYAQDSTHTPFSLHGQYDNTSNNEYGEYLFYDGHTGYDYPTNNGTPVYATTTGGNVLTSVGDEVVVDHGNGYKSHYLHLSSRAVVADDKTYAGVTKIGTTGSGHLHYTLTLYGVRVDPYGWSGGFADPSRPFAVNVPLWK